MDGSTDKITLKHGPIKSLGMDEGMTIYRDENREDEIVAHAERRTLKCRERLCLGFFSLRGRNVGLSRALMLIKDVCSAQHKN